MKRIALALATIALTAGSAFMTTYATWTDTVTVTNNKIVTGSVDLLVSTDSGGTWDTTTKASTMTLSDLIPGAAATSGYSFSLFNNSTAGAAFTLTALVSPAATITNPAVDRSQLMIELYRTDTSATEVAEQTLTAWEGGASTFTFTLPAGSTRSYGFKARLVSTAANEWQGQTVTYTLSGTGSTP